MTAKLTNLMPRREVSGLFLSGDSADLKFAFDAKNGKKFLPAHRSVLSENSSVFRSMFVSSLHKKEVHVNIVNASYSGFEKFLQFFYLKEVTLTLDNIDEVIILANNYGVIECSDMCAMFLESICTFDNLFSIRQLADKFDFRKLSRFCEYRIQYSTLEMFDSSAFLDLEDNHILEGILLHDALACTESQIFDACIAWAKNCCRRNGLDETKSLNLRQQLGDCLYLIRFRAMSDGEIQQIMTNPLYAGMFSHEELENVLCLRNGKDFKAEKFCSKLRVNLSFKRNGRSALIGREL